MKDAPAFDFYPERWLVGVASLSDAEQLAYLRLLCHQWLSGDAGLPDDPAALKRLAGKGVTPALLIKFPVSVDGCRRNARLEIVRAEQRARIEKKSQQRKAAAMRRWHPSASETDAGAMRPHESRISETDAGAMPTTHHPPPSTESIPKRESLVTPPREPPTNVKTPTLEQVKAWAVQLMAPPECAECFHADHEARPYGVNGLWTSRDGTPVANPQAAFRAFATRWKANDHQRKNQHANRPTAPSRSDSLNPPGRYS